MQSGCLGRVALFVRAALLAAVAVLVGCGGGVEGSAQAPDPAAALPELAGRVSDGLGDTDIPALLVTVKGQAGLARTAGGRLAPQDAGDYLVSLDKLDGPYLLSNAAASSVPGLYALVLGPGTANLTPLTTLLVAQLLGAEPGAYFESLGMQGGVAAIDQAAIDAAEQRMRRHLKREFGIELPADLGPVTTTAYQRVAGDPMHDAIVALAARVGDDAAMRAAVAALAQESARCKLESAVLTGPDGADDFCPLTKANDTDANDAGLRVAVFTNRRGESIELRFRGTVVDLLRHTDASGAVAQCTGAACTGVTIGTPAADGTQPVGLAGTTLAGTGDSLRLDGTLTTSRPGITLPGLPCSSQAIYLIDEAARNATGYCAQPDDFGLGAAGQSQPSGATRRVYTFADVDGSGRSLEVVVQGTSVVRALVYDTDPNTGRAVPRHQCRGAGCGQVTVGPATVDESLGVPVVLLPLRFDRTALQQVLADGSLSATVGVLLQASLVGWHIEDPAALPFATEACTPAMPHPTAQVSDEAAALDICEPDDPQGFVLRSTSIDEQGRIVLGIGSLLGDGTGNYTTGQGLNVTLAADGSVAAVSFDRFNGPRFTCEGAACAGVTVGTPDETGARTVTLAGTTLVEQGTGSLPADRTVVVQGSFIAPP